MKRYIYYLILIFALVTELFSQGVTISGKIVNQKNVSLPFVNVYILNSLIGAVSNEKGQFKFVTTSKGELTIIASMIGYEKRSVNVEIKKKNISGLIIVLEEDAVELEEAVVMGSSFSSATEKGIVISQVDVLTTPGGAADLYQSLKTMPGVTNVSESAELYVRGGDPIETVTMIDQASVYHPYTYESSYGGLFSNLNTSSINSMYFSSGGFSVKYGNVLSGVLDIETKDQPFVSQYNIGISLAAASIGAQIPILENKFGISVYTQKSYTEALMWMNGDIDDFTAAPTSQDLTTILSYNYSKTGKVKVLGTLASDAQGVKIDRAEFDGSFIGSTSNSFINIQQRDIIGKSSIIKNSLSHNQFSNSWQMGSLDLDQIDKVFKFRSDFESILSGELKISAGIEYENRKKEYIGRIPKYDFNIRPDAESSILDAKIIGQRIGTYAEITLNNLLNISKLHFVGGIRSDYFLEIKQQSFDPRAGLIYRLNQNSLIKFSWGLFHQLPDMRLFVTSDGNQNLKSMKAQHYLVSFDLQLSNKNMFRIDLYYKDYSSLPLEDEKLNYSSNGYGFAYGADIVLKGKLPLDFEGWISYGYLNTQRLWMDYDELARSNYDITHGLTLILKYNVNAMWQIGFNLKYSTGRPYTPIIGSEYLEDKNIFKPIFGLVNSASYPNYKRLDMRLTHFNQLFSKYFTVFYIEALNILNIDNLFDYTYTFDYSKKKNVHSYFGRRTIVVGMSITI